MSARVTAVRPAWAIEGGRITIEGTGFPVDRPELPGVLIGGARARPVYASSTAIGVLVPAGLEGGQAAISVDGEGGGRLGRRRRRVRDGPAPGGQPRLRPPGQSLRHLQRHPRAGSARVHLQGAAERHARDVLLGHRQRHVDGHRSGGPPVRVEPVRGHRVPRGRRRRVRIVRHGPRRRVRPGVRGGRDAVCGRSVRHAVPRRSAREGGAVRVDPAERGGVSPRHGTRRRRLRHGADALGVRLGVPRRS